MALKSDGTVWAWGHNQFGQLGDHRYADRHTLVLAHGLTGAIAISAGTVHTVALRDDGTVWTWGRNCSGQLGIGSQFTVRSTPTQVDGLTGVVAIAAGNHHTVALKEDGTVWAWGRNSDGQLGDGSFTNRWTPVQIQHLDEVTAITAGGMHTLALRDDGMVWAWGRNEQGQLGEGPTWAIRRSTPVRVHRLIGARAMAAGFAHTVALKSDGTVWTWGWNGHGQLGDGSTTDRAAPVPVVGSTDVVAYMRKRFPCKTPRVIHTGC